MRGKFEKPLRIRNKWIDSLRRMLYNKSESKRNKKICVSQGLQDLWNPLRRCVYGGVGANVERLDGASSRLFQYC